MMKLKKSKLSKLSGDVQRHLQTALLGIVIQPGARSAPSSPTRTLDFEVFSRSCSVTPMLGRSPAEQTYFPYLAAQVPPVVQNEMGQRYSGDSSENVPRVPSSPTPKHHEFTHQLDPDEDEVELPPPMQVLGDQRLSTNQAAQTAKDIAIANREEHTDMSRIPEQEPECGTNSDRSQNSENTDGQLDVPVSICEAEVDTRTPEEKALNKRTYVMKELIDTERDYVKDLSMIIDGYLKWMLDPESEIPVPDDLKDGKAKILFGNIEQIYQWHRDTFMSAVEKCVDSPADLGPLFKKYERKFLMYVVYCQNKPKSEYIVSEHMDAYFEEIRQILGHRLTIADLLIKPVQRIMKYQLLLRDLMRYTETAKLEDEVALLSKACEVMTVVPKEANDMMTVGRLQGFDGKITAQGKLMGHGRLSCSDSAGQNFRNANLQVFLFEQAIMFSEIVGGKSKFSQPDFIYKTHVQMNKLVLEQSPEEHKFTVKSSDPRGSGVSITCHCISQSQYQEWVEPLSSLLQKQRDFLRAIQSPIDYQKRLTRAELSPPLSRSKSIQSGPTSPIQSRPTKMLSLDSPGSPPVLPDKRRSGIPSPSGRNVNNNIDAKVTRTPSLRAERVMERRDDVRRSSFLLPKKSLNSGTDSHMLSPKLFGRKTLLEGLKSGLNRSKSKDDSSSMKEKPVEPSVGSKAMDTESFDVAEPNISSASTSVSNQSDADPHVHKSWSFKFSRRPSEPKSEISKRLSTHDTRSPKSVIDPKIQSPVRKISDLQIKSLENTQKSPVRTEKPVLAESAKKPPRPVRVLPKSPVQSPAALSPAALSPGKVRRDNWSKSKQSKIVPL